MHKITGNLFESVNADAICITTNGFVNSAGANTMGAGVAAEAKHRWPGIQLMVGSLIRSMGNKANKLTLTDESGQIYLQETLGKPAYPRYDVPYHIVTFPTKPEKVTNPEKLLPKYQVGGVPTQGWKAQSDPYLITQSAFQLMDLTAREGWQSVVLPRPGCGQGGLSWEDEVRPLLETCLDDRFFVIDYSR